VSSTPSSNQGEKLVALTEKFDSKKSFKAAFRSSGGQSSGLFRRFKDGERITLRFLAEMDEWERGYYHFIVGSDGKSQFLWCSRRDDCPGCVAGAKQSSIWLANALLREEGKVQIIQIPASVAKQLDRKDESAGTICDRDYIISREGKMLEDTKYFLDWEDRSAFNANRYKSHDIPAAIMTELGIESEDNDPQDEEEPKRPGKKSRTVRENRHPSSRFDRDDDEPEDEVPAGFKAKKKKKLSAVDDSDEEKPRKTPAIVKRTIKASNTTRVVRRTK
jgi:hypothetical protein